MPNPLQQLAMLLRRVRFYLNRERFENELAEEMRFHVEMKARDHQHSGMSDADARRRASIEFGGIVQVQEEVRDTWTWGWLDAFVADVRYAMRGLLRSWGFSLGTVAVGKRADLLLLDANPLEGLDALRDPVAVVLAGEWLPRAWLRQER